jgi:hypothetical protein
MPQLRGTHRRRRTARSVLNRHDWPPGSVVYRGSSEPNLCVVDVLPSDDPEKFAILVVEEAYRVRSCGLA